MLSSQPSGTHVIVIGGSMAGMLAARMFSNHFDRVTVVERDAVNDAPEPRKGQPQARHLHGLLAKGLDLMTHYFPDLPDALAEQGAIFTDMGAGMRWHAFGGYRRQYESGLIGVLMSRPLLEWQIRRRVLALPNVILRDRCGVVNLLTATGGDRVTGVVLEDREQAGEHEELLADLVVDASGRGSASPKWLAELGYAPPVQSEIKVSVGYATRLYRRCPGDLTDAALVMVAPAPPHGKRTGLIFPIEGDRWIVTLGGWAGDHPPTDEAGFIEFARTLPVPDIYNMLRRLEPLSEIITHKLPSSLRRHYEKLSRFPAGFLVMGDAICSFNPVYGQGMTSAVMQVAALDELLQEQRGLEGLAWRFFQRAAKVIDTPWQLAVGEDFRFAETSGPKAPGTDLINAYVTKVHQATHHDTVVYGAFLQVMNLMKPPTSLFHPRIVWRVLNGRHSKRHPALNPASAT